MASSKLLDLVVTIVSAKHLKNVNWREGDLKPYVILYLDPDNRLSTRSDDTGCTKPVWNERITLPLTRPIHESILTLEIFHSKSSDLAKTLVGSVRFPLAHLVDSDAGMMLPETVHALELVRPSGRPQGRIRLKLAIKEGLSSPLPPPPPTPRQQTQNQDYYSTPQGSYYYSSAPSPTPPAPIPVPSPPTPRRQIQHDDYHCTPQGSYYYSSAPPPGPPVPIAVPSPPHPHPRDYREFPPPYPYTDHYHTGFYYPRTMHDRPSNHGLPSGPSAPIDSISYSVNDHKPLLPTPLAPRLPNFVPQPSEPSAPVDASFPTNDNSQHLPIGLRQSNSYVVPSGPSAPVDYSPYDHRQCQKMMSGLSLEDDRPENDFGMKPSYSYGGDYRRDR